MCCDSKIVYYKRMKLNIIAFIFLCQSSKNCCSKCFVCEDEFMISF